MSLIKSSAMVGGLTMISRVLGFIRDILLARFLGAGLAADAFFVAFKLPNFFRRLFAEGAFSAAFVPLFAQANEQGTGQGRTFAEQVLAALLPILILFTAVMEIFMPWLVLAITGGFYDAPPEKFELAVHLTRITFPFLALISLTSLISGALNGLGRFAAPAAAPILLNISLITALIFFHDNERITAQGLAIAITVAGLLQFLWLLWVLDKAGLKLRLRLPRFSTSVKRMLLIAAPAAIGAGAQQLNLLIDTILASRFLPEGSISYLYFGDRLSQLPIGVIGVAIGTVLLPTLSRQISKGEAASASHHQNRAIEFAMFLTLPAAFSLIVIGEDILHVLFERGAFDAQATHQSAKALAAYAIGLPAYVLIKVLTPGFFARQDTKTPVKIATFTVFVNSALGIALLIPLAHVGLALATAIAAWLNAGLLYAILKKRGHFSLDKGLKIRAIKMVFASVILIGFLHMVSAYLAPILAGHARAAIAALIILIGGGLTLYMALSWIFGAVDRGQVKALLKRRA